MPRVRATKNIDINYERVMKGSTGELTEQSQDGDTSTVRWDWALKAGQSAPFYPVTNLMVEVPSDSVEATD
jgi:hypothetical protein